MKRLFSKHLAVFLTGIVLFSKLCAVDLGLHFYPSYDYSIKNFLNKVGGFSENAGFEVSPLTIRERDKLFISAEVSYTGMPVHGFPIQTIMDGEIGAGYKFRISDNFAAFAQLYGGLWSYKPSEQFNIAAVSGLLFGGRLGAEYYIAPAFSVTAFGGFKSFYTKPSPLFNNIQVGIGVKYNLSRGLINSTSIKIEENEVEPLFPVFYSHYSENPFGYLAFSNQEENDIYDVEVSVYVDSYMTTPFVVYSSPHIMRGEGFEAPICAMFNENILDLLQPKYSDLEVTVSYYSLGKKVSSSFILPVTALSRNSMTWEDDRRAACFVSAKDGSARYFANHVRSAVKDSLKSGIPENVQYAQAMFGALKAYGINYVIDASSAFTANTGTAQIDSLNFPYQTLLYHGGDCDDLTILNCSLLEALGIQTALVTVPGHIYMAVDTGLAVQEVSGTSNASKYVIQDNKVWLLVEVTLCQDTWDEAKRYGLREWNKYAEERRLYPLEQAWELYKPIGIADSNMTLDLPTKKQIVQEFSKTF